MNKEKKKNNKHLVKTCSAYENEVQQKEKLIFIII